MTISEDASKDPVEAQLALHQILEDELVALNHELRTPLTAIKGYATSLLRHDHRLTRHERLEMLREIDMACDRMTAVIEQTTRVTSEAVTQSAVPLESRLVARGHG